MDSVRTPSRKLKRGRPTFEATSSSPLSGVTPVSSIKRRKTENVRTSPSTPKALQALKSVIGGVLGLRRKNESVLAEEMEDTDELLMETPTNPAKFKKVTAESQVPRPDEIKINGSERRREKVKGQSSKTDTPTEDTVQHPLSKAERKRSRLFNLSTTLDEQSTAVAEATGDEYEEPSDDVPDTVQHRPKPKLPGQIKSRSVDTAVPDSQDTKEEGTQEDEAPSGTGRSSDRDRRKPRTYSNEVAEAVGKLQKRSAKPSGKKCGRPRKSVTFGAGSGVEDSAETFLHITKNDNMDSKAAETPKPLQRKRGRPRKEESIRLPTKAAPAADLESQVQDETATGKESWKSSRLETRILPPKKLKRPTEKIAAVVEPVAPYGTLQSEEDDDDAKCVICDGGDSEAPNEIIFCDNCGLAAHQKCYGVEVIPEGDWLCNDCCPDEEDAEFQAGISPATQLSLDLKTSDAPEIDGFEYQLQIMQRLLLDKLTGQRRLKLCGLDEESRKVNQLVEQTVLAGEGNSMLVIGARGCGKTTVSLFTYS